MNKALYKILATVCAAAMILGFLPVAMFHVAAAPTNNGPYTSPVATTTAPCLFLVGLSTLQGLDFYQAGTNATAGGTFTIQAWVNTTYNEAGWVGAFLFNATQIHCTQVAFTANSSSQSYWMYDNGIYAPSTGTTPFLDYITPASPPDNVAGSIGEPNGFGEVALSPGVLPATSPRVELLLNLTFPWQAAAIPAQSGSPISGTISWDTSVAFIVGTSGSADPNTAYGNYNYVIKAKPLPPPSIPYIQISPETSTTFATVTGPTGYDANNVIGTTFVEDVNIYSYDTRSNMVNASVEVDYSNTALLTVTGVTFDPAWTGTVANFATPGVVTLFGIQTPATNGAIAFAKITFKILSQQTIPPASPGTFDYSHVTVNTPHSVLMNTTGQVARSSDVNAPDVEVYAWLSITPAGFIVTPALTTEGPEPCVGSTFVVNVTVDPGMGNNIIGAQFVLQYNSTLMQPLSVAEGPFFVNAAAAADDGEVTFPNSVFNSNIGTWGPNVLFADIILPNETTGVWVPPFPSSPDVVAEITFECMYQPPTGSITSALTILNDPSASFVVGFDVVNQIITYPAMYPPVNALYTVTTPTWQVGRAIDLYGGAVNSGHGNLVTGSDSPFPITEGNDWAFPAPYGGQGPNNPMDMVEPQSQVYLNAYVSYNGWPVQNKNVAFEITEPDGTLYMKASAFTDSDGIAMLTFRMPWPCDPNQAAALLGKWNVVATVELADVVVNDTMNFKYDYIIHITSVTTSMSPEYITFTSDPNGLYDYPQWANYGPYDFDHGDTVTIYINFTSYFMQEFPISEPFPVLIVTSIVDNLGVTIGTATYTTTIGGAVFCTYSQYFASLQITIPKWAYAGIATVNTAAFDGLEPVAGGVAITPEYVGPTIAIMPA